jgi:undecaprenyl-diphosphatase
MRLRVLAATGVFVLFVALVGAVLTSGPPVMVDEAVSAAALRYGLAHPGWVSSLRVATHGGDGLVLGCAGAAVCAWLLVARRLRDLAVVAVGLVAAGLLLPAAQYAIGRPRPAGGFVFIEVPAFPSGHTMHATTESALAVLLLWRRVTGRARGAVVAAAVCWAVGIGATRVGLRARADRRRAGGCWPRGWPARRWSTWSRIRSGRGSRRGCRPVQGRGDRPPVHGRVGCGPGVCHGLGGGVARRAGPLAAEAERRAGRHDDRKFRRPGARRRHRRMSR